MSVRMKDIAKDVGVSAITVSKALRNHPDISVRTRERILSRVQELNYQPNLTARALVTGKTFAIGLVVPDLVHPFFGEIAKGLTNTIRGQGYDLVIASSGEKAATEDKAIEKMLARRVDGLIVASVQRSCAVLALADKRGVPYVLIDRYVATSGANFVGVDDDVAGTLATEHLIERGCRRIAHIRGPEVSTAEGREAGFRRVMQARGLPVPDDYVVIKETGDIPIDISGRLAMEKLLETRPRPDGVFCYNDPSAMGAMQAILDAGLSIPGDIAVIGCGNAGYSKYLRIPLSSVDQKSSEIGRRAGTLALDLIDSKTEREPVRVLLEPSLVVRASTALAGH